MYEGVTDRIIRYVKSLLAGFEFLKLDGKFMIRRILFFWGGV